MQFFFFKCTYDRPKLHSASPHAITGLMSCNFFPNCTQTMWLPIHIMLLIVHANSKLACLSKLFLSIHSKQIYNKKSSHQTIFNCTQLNRIYGILYDNDTYIHTYIHIEKFQYQLASVGLVPIIIIIIISRQNVEIVV